LSPSGLSYFTPLSERPMSVTESLLRVFRVDQQIRGLTTRLTAAERFLAEQVKQAELISSKRAALHKQLLEAKSKAHAYETEIKAIDEKMDKLKGQMDSAQTNKEYKALLTELNTHKADKSSAESDGLGLLTKVDELTAQIAELDKQGEEREKVKKVAESDRQKKAEEISGRLKELQDERAAAASSIGQREMAIYVELVRTNDDEAMAPVEELDRRNHEYTCGACRMTVPVEKAAALMKPGFNELVRCASCRCILYIEKATAEMFGKKGSPRTTKSGKKGKSAEQEQEV
jgi:uncharacterized protein